MRVFNKVESDVLANTNGGSSFKHLCERLPYRNKDDLKRIVLRLSDEGYIDTDGDSHDHLFLRVRWDEKNIAYDKDRKCYTSDLSTQKSFEEIMKEEIMKGEGE